MSPRIPRSFAVCDCCVATAGLVVLLRLLLAAPAWANGTLSSFRNPDAARVSGSAGTSDSVPAPSSFGNSRPSPTRALALAVPVWAPGSFGNSSRALTSAAERALPASGRRFVLQFSVAQAAHEAVLYCDTS